MRHGRWVGSAGVLLAVCFLVACGGGSGPQVGGGIGGTGKPGVVFGGVTVGTGIEVAGTTFTTAQAEVRIGGAPATRADLRDGHVALVEGVIDVTRGVADRITVEEVIKGELQARPLAGVLRVQGQTVEIDERTVFGNGIEPSSADGLTISDLLKVWGFVKGPGLVHATRIEREDSLSEIRIVGIAANVDVPESRFDIGAQPVDHREADVSMLPGGVPKDDDLVRVRGSRDLGGGGEVVATVVEPFGIEGQGDNDATHVEGFVTGVFPGVGFRLGSSKVTTSGDTVYIGGTADDLLVGVELGVEGAVVGGLLKARKVEFKDGLRIESDVDAVAGELISLVGFPRLVVRLDSLTRFKGNAATVSDIKVGDHLQIRARIAGPSTAVAVEVKETDPDTDVLIQGPVDASPIPSNPVFSILGVVINTSGIADGSFGSPTGGALDRADFFAMLFAGRVVKVQGELVVADPVWDEAELEEE